MADDGTALGRWPSFRAALETARRGTRGHLEAFLGVAPGTSEPRRPPRGSGPREPLDLRPYGVAVLMVAAALGVAFPLAQVFDVPNAPLVFIAPIVVSAVRHGRAPSLLATTLATLAYNLFFLPPLYTLTIAAPSNVVAFVCFGAVALVTSGLAARARAEMLAARTQARTAAELYAFSRTLTGTADLDGLLRATTRQIAAMLRVEAIILLPGDDGTLEVVPASSPEDQLDEADLDIARWAWEHDQAAGRGADVLPEAERLFLPMRTGRGRVGVLGVAWAAPDLPFSPDERRLLDTLLDQAALAVERVQLARRVDEGRLLTETERLRAALLTSVSHDLKTPLASILGTITSLRTYGALYDQATREEMLATAQEEAERLGRFLENVLDMNRLEGGAVGPRREPVDLADVVGSALRRAERLLAGHRVTTTLPVDLPLLSLDFTLTEQVLVNLLENAAQHTPRGTTVEIVGWRTAYAVTLEVRDEGSGVARGEAERIFDKFYRGREGDMGGGTGLGLAVCRGFVEAMGGTILARNRDDRSGSIFRMSFPAALVAEPPAEPPDAPA